MKLQHTDIIDAASDDVYRLVKNELPAIATYLPSIEKIERLQSIPLGNGQEKIINHWFAQVDMPTLVRRFLSKELLSWKDTALWNDHKKCVTYELESFLANELFDAKGTNFFKPHGNGKCELEVRCEIVIRPEKIPGIPTIMMKKAVPLIENIIGKMLQPNLSSLGKGIKAYLAAVS